MTEAEWLACEDPLAMLEAVRGKVSDRKLRLFAVASCRPVEELIPRGYRDNLPLAERLADGQLKRRPDRAIGMAGWCPAHDARAGFIPEAAGGYTVEKDAMTAAQESSRWAALAAAVPDVSAVDHRALAQLFDSVQPAVDAMRKTQAALLRCICGSPLKLGILDAAWLSPTVANLAKGAYDNRAFDRLPILADALEDAGCDNRDILDHCRQPGEHVRGCWVVDLVLGKE